MKFISKSDKILTIGDGDLSFSLALVNLLGPVDLTATTYDSLEQLKKKYDPFINHTVKQL